MGSIADLLGNQLPPEWRGERQEVATLEEEVAQAASRSETPEAELGPRGIVLAAVLQETGYDPEAIRADLQLREDLELTGLPLWAVIAKVERDLGKVFPDELVRSWTTLGDLLEAAAS